MDWREAAAAEVEGLKPALVEKFGWQPQLVNTDNTTSDVFIRMVGRRFPDRQFVLRLRYRPDWQQAGRREAFVDPDDHDHADPEFWPEHGAPLNPNHVHNNVPTPVICLHGVWGFHSVLHPDVAMADSQLVTFLRELQKVLDG